MDRFKLSFSDKMTVGFVVAILFAVSFLVVAKWFDWNSDIGLCSLIFFSSISSAALLFSRWSRLDKTQASSKLFTQFRDKLTVVEAVMYALSGLLPWLFVNGILQRRIRKLPRKCEGCNHQMLYSESDVNVEKKEGTYVDVWTCASCKHQCTYGYRMQEFFRECPKCHYDNWGVVEGSYQKDIRLIYTSTQERQLVKCLNCGYTEIFETINNTDFGREVNRDWGAD